MDCLLQIKDQIISFFGIYNRNMKEYRKTKYRKVNSANDFFNTSDLIRCINCNQLVISTNSLKSNENFDFCSEECLSKFEEIKRNTNKTGLIKDINQFLKCDHCGNSLADRTTFMYKDHKFCSYRCKGLYNHSNFNIY